MTNDNNDKKACCTIFIMLSLATIAFPLSIMAISGRRKIVSLPVGVCSINEGAINANYDGPRSSVEITNTLLNTTTGTSIVTLFEPAPPELLNGKSEREIYVWIAIVEHEQTFDCYYDLKSKKAWKGPINIVLSVLALMYSCVVFLCLGCCIVSCACNKLNPYEDRNSENSEFRNRLISHDAIEVVPYAEEPARSEIELAKSELEPAKSEE